MVWVVAPTGRNPEPLSQSESSTPEAFCTMVCKMSKKGKKIEKLEDIMLNGTLKCRSRVSKMAVWEGYALS